MATLTFSKEEYDKIVGSLKGLGLFNRSRGLRNGMAACGAAVKRAAKEQINEPGYAGDIIEDLPLREALKSRTMQWDSGKVAMTTIVTYNYQTTAQHGHLVDHGHILKETTGVRRTHLKRRIPGRAPHWRTGLAMGARTLAKHYIDNAAEQTKSEQFRIVSKSIKYVIEQEKKGR